MTVSIVIPNYNGEYLLKKNLPKVIDSLPKDKDIQVVVTDDNSTDNSLSFLGEFKHKLPKHILFTIIANEKNRGFSGNVNIGVKNSTGEIVILLNTDVIPHKGFLDKLLIHFSDSQVFAVGCMDESVEDGKIVLRGRGKGQWEKGFLAHSAADVSGGNTTLWVSGGSGAFRRSIWEKIGGLNELYNPFYWEDIDLSFRAQKFGYLVLFEKESKVIHEHSLGAIKTQETAKRVSTIAYRNQFFFVWLNITDFWFILTHLLWAAYHMVNALKSGNTAFLAGFFQATTKLPIVLRYRAKALQAFVKSDRQILGAIN